MNTWLVHILITPRVRLPVEVEANNRYDAARYARDAADHLGLTSDIRTVDIEVKRIIQ